MVAMQIMLSDLIIFRVFTFPKPCTMVIHMYNCVHGLPIPNMIFVSAEHVLNM